MEEHRASDADVVGSSPATLVVFVIQNMEVAFINHV